MNEETTFTFHLKKIAEQCLSEIKDALGGEAAFEKIEIFKPTVYFDQMEPRFLPLGHSVARGLYCSDSTGIQRHAISCKIRLKQECAENLTHNEELAKDAFKPFVMTFSEERESFQKEDSEDVIKNEKWMWYRGTADHAYSKRSSFIKISNKGMKPNQVERIQASRFTMHLTRLRTTNFKENCDFLRNLIEGRDPYFELVPKEANPNPKIDS